MKQVLTIAGSDSGGGAGIQADIKAMSAHGVFAMSVITAITAQNTEEVTEVFELPTSIIEAQIDAVFDDFEVAAVKIGAVDYLAKPADANDVTHALLARNGARPTPPDNPMSADRVRWEHIQRVYELCDRNVSETARRLGMHRRTLQRILSKRSPK